MKRRFYVTITLLLAFGLAAGAQGRGPARPAAGQDSKESIEQEKKKEPELTFKQGLF